MNSQRTKLIIGVVLLGVAASVYLVWGRGGSPLSDTISYVCVATGKVYRIARDDIPSVVPAPNPDTGEMTLLPCGEENGKLHVGRRYARYLQDLEQAKVNRYVDPQTLEVLESPRP